MPICLLHIQIIIRQLSASDFSKDLFKALFPLRKGKYGKPLIDSKIEYIAPNIPRFMGFQQKLFATDGFDICNKSQLLPNRRVRVPFNFNMNGLYLPGTAGC